MKLLMTKGLAIALLAGAMGIGDARANWPIPSVACDATTAGTLYTLEHYTPWTRSWVSITYYCNGYGWELWEVCDLSPGGICVAY